MTASQSDHWSDYWAQGCITSLPQDFAANYDGEVAEFWNSTFQEIANGGRVVDLCTGNGAIALLAAAYSQNKTKGFEITAVDAATINPAALVEKFPAQQALLGNINFFSNCRVEDITLADASFDLVCSQYGIEYCDWTLSAAQVFRLLAPEGKLVMVNHSASSDIMKFMEQEHQQYLLLDKSGFFSSIQGYLGNTIDFNNMRNTLLDLHGNLTPVVQRGGTPLFRSVHNILGGILSRDQQSLEAGRSQLDQYYRQARFGFDRLADMLRVNQAIESDPHWYGVFESAGLNLDANGELRYQESHHAGVWFRFSKPGQESNR